MKTGDLTNFRARVGSYFELSATALGDNQKEAVAWRLRCFEHGLCLADFVEERLFPLPGKRVLDVAAGWGGHAFAFAWRRAKVFSADLTSHAYPKLSAFIEEEQLLLSPLVADCEYIPLAGETVDFILALEIIEHIPRVEKFASEIHRILKPGGAAIVSTPPRLLSFFEGEPHYGIKGLTILPLRLQRIVATKLFRRSYPFPISHQFLTARSVMKPFLAVGLTGEPVLRRRFRQLFRFSQISMVLVDAVVWDFVVLRKAASCASGGHA